MSCYYLIIAATNIEKQNLHDNFSQWSPTTISIVVILSSSSLTPPQLLWFMSNKFKKFVSFFTYTCIYNYNILYTYDILYHMLTNIWYNTYYSARCLTRKTEMNKKKKVFRLYIIYKFTYYTKYLPIYTINGVLGFRI